MVELETLLSWVLRTGVSLAAALMALGYFLSPGVLWLGVIVLALTPLVRAVMSGLLFLRKGEMFFFIIASYVILILVISILIV